MKKRTAKGLDFVIDKLTNSIDVSFVSKTQLIDHYTETLGAFHAGGRLMIIETGAAVKLMNRYFKKY